MVEMCHSYCSTHGREALAEVFGRFIGLGMQLGWCKEGWGRNFLGF